MNSGRKVQLPPPRILRTGGSPPGTSSGNPQESSPVTAAMLAALERLSQEPPDVLTLAEETVRIVSTFRRVAAAAYLAVADDGSLKIAAHNWSGFAFERDEFRNGLLAVCRRTSQSRMRETFLSGDMAGVVTWCLPVTVQTSQASDVLAVSVSTSPESLSLADHQPIEHLLSSLRVWHLARIASERDCELKGLAAIVELEEMIEQALSLSEACHTAVNQLKIYLGCHQVAIGISRGAGARLAAISGVPTFDAFSDTARRMQSACDETVVRETLAAWPPLNPHAEHSILALRELAEQQNTGAVAGLPLLRSRTVVGVLILTGAPEALLEAHRLNWLSTAAPILGRAIDQVRRLEGGWMTRLRRRISASPWSTRCAVIFAAAAITAILLMPWPYRMKVPCRLEPEIRRMVSAPYDGLVDTTFASAGDLVESGDVLARMDAREIRWELSSVISEKSQADREYDAELAAENIARAQLARMEAERLQQKMDLLQFREQNHELLAPLSGVVLTGSMEMLQGAPVRTGQPLFEIAELHPLRLELAIPANDYFHVRAGQPVSVAFDGFDGEEFEGRILRVRPRSEIRDSRNVFVAELEIPNPDFRLRPGIEGHATITGDRHSVAWNTFHKAWEAVWRADPTAILTEQQSVSPDSLIAARKSSRHQRRDSPPNEHLRDDDHLRSQPLESTRLAEQPGSDVH